MKKQKVNLLHITCFTLFALIFIVDLYLPLGVATGILYVPVILIARLLNERSFLINYAALSTVLIIIGYILSEPHGHPFHVFLNRSFSVFSVWAIAIGSYKYLTAKVEKLVEEQKHLRISNIIASIHASIAIIDQDGIIRETNEKWSALMVDNEYDLIGKPVDTNIFKLKRDVNRTILKDSFDAIKTVNSILNGLTTEEITEIQLTSGEWFRVHISRIEGGKGAVVCCFEITKEKQLDRAILQSRCHLYSSQLNPHFIFNSLSSVQYYILDHQVESAIDYLSSFAQLMRATLENSFHTLIPIEKEIDYLKKYIDLEKLRSEAFIEHTIEIVGGDPEEILIPPMLLQPFIENAIVHGLSANVENKHLSIKFDVKKTSVTCIVEDNGTGRPKITSASIAENTKRPSRGIQLINDKLTTLNALYGGGFKLDVVDKLKPDGSAAGTKIMLSMPRLYETNGYSLNVSQPSAQPEN